MVKQSSWDYKSDKNTKMYALYGVCGPIAVVSTPFPFSVFSEGEGVGFINFWAEGGGVALITFWANLLWRRRRRRRFRIFLRLFEKKWPKKTIKPISETGFRNFRKFSKNFQLFFQKKLEKISLLNRPKKGLKFFLRGSKNFCGGRPYQF